MIRSTTFSNSVVSTTTTTTTTMSRVKLFSTSSSSSFILKYSLGATFPSLQIGRRTFVTDPFQRVIDADEEEDMYFERSLTPPISPTKMSKQQWDNKKRDRYDSTAVKSNDHPDDSYNFIVRPKYMDKDIWPDVHDPPYPVFDENDDSNFLPEILAKKKGYTKFAILNRPKFLHALNLNMLDTLTPVWKKWEAQEHTSELLVLSSSTPANFSSGTDFRDIYNAIHTNNTGYAKKYFRSLYELAYLIHCSNTMCLPLMNGVSMGSSAALCFNSRSFCAATEKTHFAMPETKIGFFPDTGSSHFLSHIGSNGSLGMYLALTGKRLHGHDIKAAGIASHLIPEASLEYMFMRIEQGQYDIHRIMWVLQECESNEEIPLTFEHRGHMSKIEDIFSRESVNEIIEGLKDDGSTWAQNTLSSMMKSSPLSLLITHRSLKEGRISHIRECLGTEYRLAQRLMENSDFTEGVKARIIENREPVWTTSLDMPSREIDAYFESMSDKKDELNLPPHGLLLNYGKELKQFRGYNRFRDSIRVTPARVQAMEAHSTLATMSSVINEELMDETKTRPLEDTEQ